MLEITRLRSGVKIRLKDGTILMVRGAYMSTGGIIITANDGGGIVDRNVPITEISEVIDA